MRRRARSQAGARRDGGRSPRRRRPPRERERGVDGGCACAEQPTASAGSSGGTGYSCSPESRSGARLVASTRRRGASREQARDVASPRGAAARGCRGRAAGAARAVRPRARPRGALRPSRRRARRAIAAGEQPRVADRGEVDEDGSVARRRLELAPRRPAQGASCRLPPGPVSVTSRTSSRRKSAVQRDDLEVPAEERRRRDGSGTPFPPAVARQRRVLPEDPLLERAQLRPCVDPELVDERPLRGRSTHRASPSVGRRDIARGRLRVQPLAVRLFGDERRSASTALALPELELCLVAQLDRAQPRAVEARHLRLRDLLLGEVGERRPAQSASASAESPPRCGRLSRVELLRPRLTSCSKRCRSISLLNREAVARARVSIRSAPSARRRPCT